MSERIRLSAADLKSKWFEPDAVGLIHDHQTGEVVVRMNDGSEFACSAAEHDAEVAR